MNQPLKLGIAGLGTVGAGLLQLLAEHGQQIGSNVGRGIEVAGVSARSRDKNRGVSLAGMEWFADAERLAVDPSIDVFIELIGGDDGIAKASVEAALKAGKHVVTANKALLARHGTALAGYIVSAVSGMPWEDYIEKNILEPLGMKHTMVRQPAADKLPPEQSKGYKFASGEFREEGFEYVPAAPAGSMSAAIRPIAPRWRAG